MTQSIIEPVWSDEDVERLRQRNAERVARAIEALGSAWVLYKRPAEPVRQLVAASRVRGTLRSRRA